MMTVKERQIVEKWARGSQGRSHHPKKGWTNSTLYSVAHSVITEAVWNAVCKYFGDVF